MNVGLFAVPGFLGVVLVVLMLLMRRSSTGERPFRPGFVTGIVGRKGHGKTLFVTHELLRHVGRKHKCQKCSIDQGRTVVHVGRIAANFKLRVPANLREYVSHVTRWEDLEDLQHGTLCAIDEAHMDGWMPAKAGKQLDPYVRWVLAQCRKLEVELLWSCQHEDRVALEGRRQTDEIGICRKGLMRRMAVRFYEPEDARKKDVKPSWTYRYKVTKRVAAAYNTYELIPYAGHQAAVPPTQEGAAAEAVAEIPRTVTTASGTRRLS